MCQFGLNVQRNIQVGSRQRAVAQLIVQRSGQSLLVQQRGAQADQHLPDLANSQTDLLTYVRLQTQDTGRHFVTLQIDDGFVGHADGRQGLAQLVMELLGQALDQRFFLHQEFLGQLTQLGLNAFELSLCLQALGHV